MTAAASLVNGDSVQRTKRERETLPEKPVALAVQENGIPVELKELRQWVVWRYVWRPNKKAGGAAGKWTKAPMNASSDQKFAETDNPKTWSTFQDALWRSTLAPWRCDGVGFVFAAADPYCGVDLDNARDPESGRLRPWAQAVVDALNSYTEVSPSGTGVKIFLRGHCPGSGHKKPYPGGEGHGGEIEVYDRGRFFTLTGIRLEGAPATINDAQAALAGIYARVWPPEPPPQSMVKREQEGGQNDHVNQSTANGQPDDNALLAKARQAKNGPKFSALFDRGSLSDYGDDASRADMALAEMLAFWCQRDPDRMDRLFRRSALMRAKWDDVHFGNGATYGAATIVKAAQRCRDVYMPRVRGKRKPIAGTTPPAGDAGDTADPDLGRGAVMDSAYDMILRHFRRTYQPTFRRDNVLYASALGREVKHTEACFAPGLELATEMLRCSNVPKNENGDPKENAIPQLFRSWAPSAWRDLLAELPDESQADEISGAAQEQFRGQIAAALHTLVPLTYRYKGDDGGDREEVQRRSLISWCGMFAKGKRWESIRTYCLWVREGDPLPGSTAKVVRVALRVELFAQVSKTDLAKLSQRNLTDLCKLYAIGTECKVRGGDARAVELSPGFLAEITAEPENDLVAFRFQGRAGEEWEAYPDTRTDADPSHARAREEDVSLCPGSGGKP